MQSAHGGHHIVAGAHMQMIGVAEHDLRIDAAQVLRGEPSLDGACRCDIHENRRLDDAVYSSEAGTLCLPLRFQKLIFCHRISVYSPFLRSYSAAWNQEL